MEAVLVFFVMILPAVLVVLTGTVAIRMAVVAGRSFRLEGMEGFKRQVRLGALLMVAFAAAVTWAASKFYLIVLS